MQDPQVQLNEMGVRLADPVAPDRSAILDAAHRSFVNWEIFFFADDDTKRRFDADPGRWCGVITDPVSRQRFVPGTDSPQTVYEGRPYFFFSAADLKAFRENTSADRKSVV